ncbi:hypothetical protein [Lactiplantibacillus plantarum]|uniref:hypothetical protein n=1 Tax=Lactiplantibacillus plantarum TaxID=1590 RepID=UPI002468C5CB|nr:hypothetical protein [Lactiplantibacillus plantarum]MDH5112775.1 hypothetical protein [Lactiplantibacillus plantarum]
MVDSAGISIYPSNGSTSFTIANNIERTTGNTIARVAFSDFVEAMNKAASTIAKGDPGEGLDIKGQVTSVSALPTTANEGDGYLVNEELYVYTSGAWKDCGPIQGPQGIQGKTGTGISSTTIQYQISNSATTSPTGTWSNSIVATTITNPYLWIKATLNYTDGTTKDFYLVSQKGDKGDKGDTPDLSNYTTVTDLNNGLSTKVTDNKNGTIEVNGSSITPADDSKVVHDNHNGTISINGDSFTPATLDSLAGVNAQPIDTDVNTLAKPGLYYVSKSAPNNPIKSDMMLETRVQYDWNQFKGVQIIYAIGASLGIAIRSIYPNGSFTTVGVATPWEILSDDSKVAHLSGANNFDTVPTYGNNNKPFAINDTGETTARPTGQAAGYQYFDTSLNKPIWYTGKNWVDAAGTTV